MTPEEFKKILTKMRDDEFVCRHIVTEEPGPNISPEALRHIESSIRNRFQLSDDQRVSAIVVGSAKLGFSFIEKRRNGVVIKPAYRAYEPGKSDIDVAIVSPVVYGKIWNDLASAGALETYFPVNSKLSNYMYHGWLRSDYFPSSKPQRCSDWEDARRDMYRHIGLRNKRIQLALYHSQHFLEVYQQRGIRAAREQEQTT